ncbi:hypothetical protein [Hoeflea alexandrii]|uniref:hypothetical protein n=1 Tax=Hoeflea alexandrii TaxID=288436 RepID=UPI0022AE9C7B|nr:hypothetical protein [Hoeflea alexandrii]MCZ4291624.1 hypothetical protein [Hoeflea alexandrii]
MDRTSTIIGGVLAIIAAWGLFFIVPAQIPAGFAGMLSPRLVPQIALVGIGLLGLLIAAQGLWRGAGEPFHLSKHEAAAFITVPGIILISLWLLPVIGPLGGGAMLVIGAALIMGERKPLMLAAQAAGILLLGYLLIYVVLGTTVG